MLAERVKDWTRQWKEEGREEGRQEGRQVGRQEGRLRELNFVLRQLTRRIGPIPAEVSTRIQDLPIEEVEVLGEALLEFRGFEI